MKHLEMVETSETTVEGLGGMEMRFGWDLMVMGWSGIWFMTVERGIPEGRPFIRPIS